MAKNTGRGSRIGSNSDGQNVHNPTNTWIRRDTSTGRFVKMKSQGGKFKGKVSSPRQHKKPSRVSAWMKSVFHAS